MVSSVLEGAKWLADFLIPPVIIEELQHTSPSYLGGDTYIHTPWDARK